MRDNMRNNMRNNMRDNIRNKIREKCKNLIGIIFLLAVISGCAAGGGGITAEIGGIPSTAGEQASGALEYAGGGKEQEADSSFEVHFIDVGQADSALVLCDGHAMLIDGGNAEDSSLIYSYLKKLNISHLDYIICTHGHEDHVGGLAGALNYASVDTAYAPVTSYDSKAFRNFIKYLEQQGKTITVPTAGDGFFLGSAGVQILGPLKETEEANNTSIVLKITYGETSFLFTGDAEREEEQDILESGADLKSTVLKVGHHGSDTSTSYPFLREVMPEYAVISVGKGNSYGHPSGDTLSRLSDAGATVYRTDLLGDIICTSDRTKVTFEEASGPKASNMEVLGTGASVPETLSKEALGQASSGTGTSGTAASETEAAYVLNTSTKKFHLPSCPSVQKMKESNKELFYGTIEEAIENGYSPCKQCIGSPAF